MITDTCKCGAKFSTKQLYYCEEAKIHEEWLAAHASCRAERAKVEEPNGYPLSAEEKAEAIKTFICPRCLNSLSTYRHPFAKLWCDHCGLVIREEGER